ncbi:mercuric transporter MerT family protein [Aquisalimonas asiatica]|uniref:Mercuric transport protein MerT n=1 Tax=Aquisalimonas asiatica TaxID=406100 RepID=A0A1H8T0K1_9GAMM|nr:mercuric transporter MerT family protein [Aquisalimonas asiatica]SEO84437.1 mercuric ion transport protein [Aquisalimonas asiatica]
MARQTSDNAKEWPGVLASREPTGWFAGGGVVGGLLATTCCVLPLVLFSMGVGGAWMGTLRGLEAYQPVFVVIAIAFIAAGFWSLRRRRRACTVDGYCATTAATRVTTIALWVATALVALSVVWPWLFPFITGR